MPDLLDVYAGDPVMAPAFLGMVRWAIGQPEIRAAFESETGIVLPAAARTPLDRMIDEAASVHETYIVAFTEWAYASMWEGEDDDGDG